MTCSARQSKRIRQVLPGATSMALKVQMFQAPPGLASYNEVVPAMTFAGSRSSVALWTGGRTSSSLPGLNCSKS